MKRQFKLNKSEFHRFVRYGIVGTLNTIIDFSVFALLLYVFHVNTYICQAVAFLAATFNSYAMNRSFTFKSNAKFMGVNIILFFVLNLISMSVSVGVLYFFHDIVGIQEIIAKVLTAPFVTAVNYFGNREIVFNPSRRLNSEDKKSDDESF